MRLPVYLAGCMINTSFICTIHKAQTSLTVLLYRVFTTDGHSSIAGSAKTRNKFFFYFIFFAHMISPFPEVSRNVSRHFYHYIYDSQISYDFSPVFIAFCFLPFYN